MKTFSYIEAPAVGARAPDFELPTRSGQGISLAQLRGQPVLLAFFAPGWDPEREPRLDLYRDLLERWQKIRNCSASHATASGARSSSRGKQGDTAKGEAYIMHGFGAQFCEVRVDADLGVARVVRCVGAFALGKVLNEKTLKSQLQGGIVWGIGMALGEESLLDERYARFVNSNLAEYHVPVNADVPSIEIISIADEDKLVSPIGAKGAGEIGITGAAAAIGNAIFNATGMRVRELPITLDKLMVGQSRSV